MCGRPQREDLAERDPEAAANEVIPTRESPKSAKVSFGNPDVIRATYPIAVVAAVLGSVPALSLLCFLWYPAAGFLAVYLYRRRTGIFLTPAQGAKLGAITGLLVFAISLLVLTVAFLFGGGADFSAALREAVEKSGYSEELQRSLRRLIDNPVTVSLILMVGLFFRFIATAGFTMLGGALGAKVLEKED
jgi:hypothetical protein